MVIIYGNIAILLKGANKTLVDCITCDWMYGAMQVISVYVLHNYEFGVAIDVLSPYRGDEFVFRMGTHWQGGRAPSTESQEETIDSEFNHR